MPGLTDTNPKIEAMIIEGYRRMEPAQKLTLAFEMSEAIRELAIMGIKERHPGISESELRKRLGALTLGRELSIKVNQWDPEKEGY